jgi:peptidyl-dipeptidase A
VPADSARKKNTHASAWHINLDRDVRSLMSVQPNERWFGTTHHELGHIYYYISYTRPEVPPLLREGANRAFHEGIGELIDLAARQVPYLQHVGVLKEGEAPPDEIMWLLDEALTSSVVFIPWSAGVMSRWEHDLYEENLSPDQWNARWWQYVGEIQGVEPPSPRGEEFCDAATKTHINDDPAGYYDYALSYVLLFQLHDHIAREILHQDPRDTDYFDQREVGEFLRTILTPGMSVDWKALLEEKTGSALSAEPMLRYFEPLMGWLKRQNEGRRATLAEL